MVVNRFFVSFVCMPVFVCMCGARCRPKVRPLPPSPSSCLFYYSQYTKIAEPTGVALPIKEKIEKDVRFGPALRRLWCSGVGPSGTPIGPRMGGGGRLAGWGRAMRH